MLWSSAASAQQTYTLTLLPSTLQSATKNVFFSQQITAVGGNGNYTYNLKPGDSLPPGITFSNSGLLSGTPTSSNTYTFTLEAVDNGGGSGNRPYTTFSVGAPNSITINPGSLPDGTRGVGYSQTLTTQNSSGGNVFSISGGSLPPGLSLNSSTGDITGTPNTGGTFNFTVHVLDSDGDTGTQGYSVNIIVPIIVNPASLPNGATGTPYNQTVSASNGTAPYTFAVSAGALPTSLALNAATGAITGTPSAAGNFGFTIEATDFNGSKGNRPYNVTISTAPLTINPASLPAGQVGTPYSQTVIASGGNGNYSYAVVSGSLPTGLSLNPATGDITGNPSAGGTFNFSIQAHRHLAEHRHQSLQRHHRRQLADGPPGHLAERHAERALQPDGERNRRHRRGDLRRFGRRAAGGAVARRQHRRHHRHADRQRPVVVHDPRHGLAQ